MSLGTILLINFMIALRAGFPPGTFQVAGSSTYVGKRPPGRLVQNKGTK
jgi:hypothetical protein